MISDSKLNVYRYELDKIKKMFGLKFFLVHQLYPNVIFYVFLICGNI